MDQKVLERVVMDLVVLVDQKVLEREVVVLVLVAMADQRVQVEEVDQN